MEVFVNGESRMLEKSVSIAEFLAQHNLEAKRIVVEHNRRIVPRDCFGEVMLAAGDEVEIVHMMAGG
jgi:thiamine biosynthesis protein ThiS